MRPSMWMIGTCASASVADTFFVSSSMSLFGRAPARLDRLTQVLVGLALEILERQILELVLDLAHPEPVGDRRVDVERLLGDLHAALFGQVVQRPHVVEPVGQLHQDDPDVIHHRQQHLPEVLRPRSSLDENGMAPSLVTPSTTCAMRAAPKSSLDALDGRLRVFYNVVEQARGDRDHVSSFMSRPADPPPGGDARGRAHRSGIGPGPCARRPRRRTPACSSSTSASG